MDGFTQLGIIWLSFHAAGTSEIQNDHVKACVCPQWTHSWSEQSCEKLLIQGGQCY